MSDRPNSEDVERGSLEDDTPGLDPQPESAEEAAEVFESEPGGEQGQGES